jgi:hypothetical protein
LTPFDLRAIRQRSEIALELGRCAEEKFSLKIVQDERRARRVVSQFLAHYAVIIYHKFVGFEPCSAGRTE